MTLINRVGTAKYSLADFYLTESNDPIFPSSDFVEWKKNSAWATCLYEQSLLHGPGPRTALNVSESEWPVINLTSYDYLGLSKNPEVISASIEALKKYGTGSCGSPILSGMTDLHRALESKMSLFLGKEETMLFSSGFS